MLLVFSLRASVVANPVVHFVVAAEVMLCESRLISGATQLASQSNLK